MICLVLLGKRMENTHKPNHNVEMGFWEGRGWNKKKPLSIIPAEDPNSGERNHIHSYIYIHIHIPIHIHIYIYTYACTYTYTYTYTHTCTYTYTCTGTING